MSGIGLCGQLAECQRPLEVGEFGEGTEMFPGALFFSAAAMHGTPERKSFSAIRVVSSAYLRLLIFLQTILIPACESSSPVFQVMYSACKLNKQGDNIQP